MLPLFSCGFLNLRLSECLVGASSFQEFDSFMRQLMLLVYPRVLFHGQREALLNLRGREGGAGDLVQGGR